MMNFNMEQLLAHLIGDYILQSHDMATKKTAQNFWAVFHAIMYSLSFLFLTGDFGKLLLIGGTHFLIDRFRIARYVVIAKNKFLGASPQVNYLTSTGYPEETPPFLSVWLLIIADNTLHLLINYLILK